MIVDTSAILAVIFKEPGYESLIDKLLAPSRKGMGTPLFVGDDFGKTDLRAA